MRIVDRFVGRYADRFVDQFVDRFIKCVGRFYNSRFFSRLVVVAWRRFFSLGHVRSIPWLRVA